MRGFGASNRPAKTRGTVHSNASDEVEDLHMASVYESTTGERQSQSCALVGRGKAGRQAASCATANDRGTNGAPLFGTEGARLASQEIFRSTNGSLAAAGSNVTKEEGGTGLN